MKDGRRRSERRTEMGDDPPHRKGKTRLTEQAEIAGLSLSEHVRRRFFGGRLAAHLDLPQVTLP